MRFRTCFTKIVQIKYERALKRKHESAIWTRKREHAFRAITREHMLAWLNLNAHWLDKNANVSLINGAHTCLRSTKHQIAFAQFKAHDYSRNKSESVHSFNKNVIVPSLGKTRTCIQTIKRKWAFARWNPKMHSRDKKGESMNSLDKSGTCICSKKRESGFEREMANVHLHD